MPPASLVSPELLLVAFAGGVLLLAILSPRATAGNLSARRVYLLSAFLLAASTMLLTAFEPGISLIDAFYLSCMTFTTIGYGDISHPASPAGRVIISLLALGGVAFFGVMLELVGTLRKRTVDGAVLCSLLGNDSLLAFGMLTFDLLLGVVLCNFLTEDDGLPKGFLDSLYWSVITFTSCGFGDFHPTTDLGKVCVCAYAFATMQVAANALDVAKDQFVRLCTLPTKRFQGTKKAIAKIKKKHAANKSQSKGNKKQA